MGAEANAFAFALIGAVCDECIHSKEDGKLMLLRCTRSEPTRPNRSHFLCVIERHPHSISKNDCGPEGRFFVPKV